MSGSGIKILNSQNFSKYLFARKELSIIQFHDEENASCQIMTPVFNKLQEYYEGRVVCYTVHKPAAIKIWEEFKIYQTPSYLIIKDNKTVEKITGLISYDNFKSVVERCL